MDSVVEVQIVSEKKIQNKFMAVRTKKQELRKLRKELKDNLEGDAEYYNQLIKVTEEKRKLTARKKQLESTASIEALKAKEIDIKTAIKEEQLTLSDWLVDYTRLTKNTTIPDGSNNMLEIKVKTIASVKNI